MPTFRFRKLNLADIAAQAGRASTQCKLTEHRNGVIEIETPALTPLQEATLKSYVSGRGYVEDPAAPIE